MYKSKKNDNNNKNNKDKKNTVRNSKDQERTTVTLKVAEAYHRDIGRGIARIDPKICKKLDLLTGDTIEVSIFPPQGGSNDNNKARYSSTILIQPFRFISQLYATYPLIFSVSS